METGLGMFAVNKRGFTLVEILVVAGLSSIMCMAAFYFTMSFQQGFSDLSKKADFITSQNLIQSVLVRSMDCHCLVRDKVFDQTNPDAIIDLDEIKNGCAANSTAIISRDDFAAGTGDKVQRIFISDISPTASSEEFNAKLNIIPLAQGRTFQGKSTPLLIRFYADPRTPSNAKAISGCGPVPLSIPTNLVAETAEKSCRLSWTRSTGARPIRYRAHYSEQSAGVVDYGTNACPPETDNTSCIATDLEDGKEYFFAVQALNDYEESEFSSIISCTPATRPSEVLSLTAVPGLQSCALSWTPPTKGTAPLSYRVYRSTVIGESLEARTISCSTSATSCTVSGLSPDQTYYFTALASNIAGDGPQTIPDISCRPVKPPSQPLAVKSNGSDKQCEVNWTAPLDGDPPISFTVLKASVAGESKTGTVVAGCNAMTGGSMYCKDSNLTNGATFYYSVRAQNSVGASLSSEVSCRTGLPPGELQLTTTAMNGACRISWNAPSGDSPFEYTIYESLSSIEPEPESEKPTEPTGTIDPSAPVGGGAGTNKKIVCDEVVGTFCVVNGLTNDKEYRFMGEVWSPYGIAYGSQKFSCTPKE